MKKLFLLLPIAVMLFSFCSCGNSNDPEEVIEVYLNTDIYKEFTNYTYNYELTDLERERGFISVEKKNDKVAVYKIKRKDYEAYIELIKESRKEIFDKYNTGEDELIKSVSYADDFSEIVIRVDKNDYQNNVYDNGISPNSHIYNVYIGCGMNVELYLCYTTDEFKTCTVKLVDDATGEVLRESIYPN